MQTPHIRQLGGKMHLCNLLFKVEDGRKSPECELQLDGKTITVCKVERKMSKLSISHCESELKGVYQCIVSTTEEPIVSTAVEVIINCKLKIACSSAFVWITVTFALS
jgi:arginine repressor